MLGKIPSNERGKVFEDMVGELLGILEKAHPRLVEVKRHPRLPLRLGLDTKEEKVPDFELIYQLPHQRDRRLIECQDRSTVSQDIVQKIHYAKSLSDRNRFIFVYRDSESLPDAVRRSLDADGIVHYNFVEFADFLRNLSRTLAAVSELPNDTEFLSEAAKLLKQKTFWPAESLDKIFDQMGRQFGSNNIEFIKGLSRLAAESPDLKSQLLPDLSYRSTRYSGKDEGMLSDSTPRKKW